MYERECLIQLTGFSRGHGVWQRECGALLSR